MKSKTAKSLKRRDTFFSGFQWGKKKKKKLYNENICYYLSQRDKTKIVTFFVN